MSEVNIDEIWHELNHITDEIRELKDSLDKVKLLPNDIERLDNNLEQIFNVIPVIACNRVSQVTVNGTHMELKLKDEHKIPSKKAESRDK